MALLPPLEDPRYAPRHPPTARGGVPPVVERWGVRSQRRWFIRFLPQLRPQPEATWERFYVHSPYHRGLCCASCLDEMDEGYSDYPYRGHCCCRVAAQSSGARR